MSVQTIKHRLVAEWLGTLLLLATVIGSGIMAERLADGNVAIALLGNTIATETTPKRHKAIARKQTQKL